MHATENFHVQHRQNTGQLIGQRKFGVISLGNSICSSAIEDLQDLSLHVTGYQPLNLKSPKRAIFCRRTVSLPVLLNMDSLSRNRVSTRSSVL